MDSVVFPELPTYLFETSLAGVLSLVLTFILPLMAGFLMKQSWSTGVKGTILLALATVKAFLEAWLGHVNSAVDFNFLEAVYGALINFGIAVAMYFGILKNTSLQQSAISSGISDTKIIPGQAYPRR